MNVLKYSRIGKSAKTSTSPNDFILSSEWNSPKIVKEDTLTTQVGVTVSEEFADINHGLNYIPLLLGGFVKFEDGRVGSIGTKAAGEDFFSTNMIVTHDEVRFGYNNFTAGDYDAKFKYLASEIPLLGTPNIPNQAGNRLILSKSGHTAKNNTNPNETIYDSQFDTLKYFNQGAVEVTIPETTPAAGDTAVFEVVIENHNLGYYPFHGANLEFSADDPGKVYTMPIMSADGVFWMYDMLHVTETQLIYRKEFGNAFGFTTYPEQTITIYWKVYSKDLAL